MYKISYIGDGQTNEFVFDFSALNAKFIPILLTNYLNSRCLGNIK